MSGPNQHHIPRFYQRGFGVKRSGKPKEIWVYESGVAPEMRPISKTAAEEYFYSATLDEQITKSENPLAINFHKVRAQPCGSTVDSDIAADIVTQLAPRSSHIRSALVAGFSQLVTEAEKVFTDPERVERLLGLDTDQPTEFFRERLREALEGSPEIQTVGLPQPVLERAAFYVAKENFDSTASVTVPMFKTLFHNWSIGSGDMARSGHNRALEKTDEPNVRRDHLKTLQWSVESAPAEGAVLPDCVALAYQDDSPTLPLMFVGKDMEAVAMPLSTGKLLVGRQTGAAPIDLTTFNNDAAACSHVFFLAQFDRAEFASLSDLVGTRTKAFFDEALEEPLALLTPASTQVEDAATDYAPPALPATTGQDLQYQMSFLGWEEEDSAARAFAPRIETSDTLNEIVGGRRVRLERHESLIKGAYSRMFKIDHAADSTWTPS